MGASEDVIATEEPPPSFAEGWRMVRKVQTLRRMFWALPFLAAALSRLVGFAINLLLALIFLAIPAPAVDAPEQCQAFDGYHVGEGASGVDADPDPPAGRARAHPCS